MNVREQFKNLAGIDKEFYMMRMVKNVSESDLDLMFETLYNKALENDKEQNFDSVRIFDLEDALD